MATNTAERMARMRARQRAAGLVPLSLVVPAGDAQGFQKLAARRRRLAMQGPNIDAGPIRWQKRSRSPASTSISPADILAFRELLETTAVTLVVRRMNSASTRRLRAAIEHETLLPADASSEEFQRLHLLLGELSRDEPLQLLLRIALRLTDDRSAFNRLRGGDRAQVVARVKRLHASIVEAMTDRNEALALRRMRRYLSGLRDWLE